MKLINRRENPRIEIKLRCYVAAPATRVRSAMRTENMSRNGLLIAWKSEAGAVPTPAIGQIVTVEIELPAHHGFSPKCIHCQGPVTRVSNDTGRDHRGLTPELHGFPVSSGAIVLLCR